MHLILHLFFFLFFLLTAHWLILNLHFSFFRQFCASAFTSEKEGDYKKHTTSERYSEESDDGWIGNTFVFDTIAPIESILSGIVGRVIIAIPISNQKGVNHETLRIRGV